ncbi:hypothetical protein [Bacillus massiliigorillae]|uniref:hypothetical protein n=1 Tax=Bacillus massiliigorillae TaxID=1243664 RepID=UPI0005A6AAEF|nr:hypothetical protein [Bacillus massiliigorillae]
MKITLKNNAGVTKEVKLGFSWTTFFFGFFPALFRGDLKWAAIMFIIAACVSFFTFGIGAWIPGIIFSFVYNKIYIKDLLEKGYSPINDEASKHLQAKGIISSVA